MVDPLSYDAVVTVMLHCPEPVAGARPETLRSGEHQNGALNERNYPDWAMKFSMISTSTGPTCFAAILPLGSNTRKAGVPGNDSAVMF